MRLFHPVNSCQYKSVANFNKQKFIGFQSSETYIKIFIKFQGFQICAYFSLVVLVVRVIRNLLIFHKIKVAKHIRDPFCHLVTETGS
jgi:hypothetical protein